MDGFGNHDEARLEAVSKRLGGSPALREAVAAALGGPGLEAEFTSGLSKATIASVQADAGRLETVVGVDRLEAIVRKVGRPPLVVRNDVVELEPLPDFPAGTDALIKGVEATVRSVGRVEFVNNDMAWGGTGWVIDGKGTSRVVATNRHVAKIVGRRAADGTGVFLRNPASGALYEAWLDFKEEVDSKPGDATPIRVVEILYLADDTSADIALLRIEGAGLPSPIGLAGSEAAPDDLVALIGYPAFDPRNNLGVMASYFRGLYDIKRFAPGLVMQAAGDARVLEHDCTSLGGNSGSPLIRLDGGGVVGLHFAGVYGVNNSAIGVGTLMTLLKGDRPVSVAVAVATTTETLADGVHQAADLKGRHGYDPAFLGSGVKAPWPGISAKLAGGLAKPSDAAAKRPHELRYTHFGVQFSTALRQPVMTAVNIDGTHTVRIKRADDKWFKDSRIPLEAQLASADFPGEEIDRGHMVRREDPNWDMAAVGQDAASEVAMQADLDTFHYTNASPQHKLLNRGKLQWQGLENYILNSARTKGFRACVFTGPVFRPDDPEIVPGVATPLEYWKLVAMVDAEKDALHATAYLLSQGQMIRDLLEARSKVEAVEGFVLGEYRTFQISVHDLADATGHDFSAYLAGDPLAKAAGQEAVDSGEPVYVPLDGLESIVT
jgi:endonuclease G